MQKQLDIEFILQKLSFVERVVDRCLIGGDGNDKDLYRLETIDILKRRRKKIKALSKQFKKSEKNPSEDESDSDISEESEKEEKKTSVILQEADLKEINLNSELPLNLKERFEL